MFSSERAPQLSNTASKVQWSLRFAFSCVQPVTQRYRRKTVKGDFKKCLCNNSATTKIRRFAHPQLSITASKVQRPLRFAFSYIQPVTKHHKQKNSVRIVSAINLVTTENTDNSRLQMYCREAIYWDRTEGTFGLGYT